MCRRLYSMSFRSFSLWWERTFSVSLSYSRLRLCKQIMVGLSVLMRLGSDCPWDLCDLSFVSKCALTCASVSHSGGPTLTSPEGEKQPAVPADSLMSSALPPQRAAARIRPQGADCRGFRSLSLIFLHLCDSSTPIFFSIFWVPDIPSPPEVCQRDIVFLFYRRTDETGETTHCAGPDWSHVLWSKGNEPPGFVPELLSQII